MFHVTEYIDQVGDYWKRLVWRLVRAGRRGKVAGWKRKVSMCVRKVRNKIQEEKPLSLDTLCVWVIFHGKLFCSPSSRPRSMFYCAFVEKIEGIHVEESLNATDLTECGRNCASYTIHASSKAHTQSAQTHTVSIYTYIRAHTLALTLCSPQEEKAAKKHKSSQSLATIINTHCTDIVTVHYCQYGFFCVFKALSRPFFRIRAYLVALTVARILASQIYFTKLAMLCACVYDTHGACMFVYVCLLCISGTIKCIVKSARVCMYWNKLTHLYVWSICEIKAPPRKRFSAHHKTELVGQIFCAWKQARTIFIHIFFSLW